MHCVILLLICILALVVILPEIREKTNTELNPKIKSYSNKIKNKRTKLLVNNDREKMKRRRHEHFLKKYINAKSYESENNYKNLSNIQRKSRQRVKMKLKMRIRHRNIENEKIQKNPRRTNDDFLTCINAMSKVLRNYNNNAFYQIFTRFEFRKKISVKKREKIDFIIPPRVSLWNSIGGNAIKRKTPICRGQYNTTIGLTGLQLYEEMDECTMDYCGNISYESDDTLMNRCNEILSTFNNGTEQCRKYSIELEYCSCWEALESTVENVTDCVRSAQKIGNRVNKQFDNCLKTFRNCKKRARYALEYIYKCKTSKDSLYSTEQSLQNALSLLEGVNSTLSSLINTSGKALRNNIQISSFADIISAMKNLTKTAESTSVYDLGTNSDICETATIIIKAEIKNSMNEKQKVELKTYMDILKEVILTIETTLAEVKQIIEEFGGEPPAPTPISQMSSPISPIYCIGPHTLSPSLFPSPTPSPSSSSTLPLTISTTPSSSPSLTPSPISQMSSLIPQMSSPISSIGPPSLSLSQGPFSSPSLFPSPNPSPSFSSTLPPTTSTTPSPISKMSSSISSIGSPFSSTPLFPSQYPSPYSSSTLPLTTSSTLSYNPSLTPSTISHMSSLISQMSSPISSIGPPSLSLSQGPFYSPSLFPSLSSSSTLPPTSSTTPSPSPYLTPSQMSQMSSPISSIGPPSPISSRRPLSIGTVTPTGMSLFLASLYSTKLNQSQRTSSKATYITHSRTALPPSSSTPTTLTSINASLIYSSVLATHLAPTSQRVPETSMEDTAVAMKPTEDQPVIMGQIPFKLNRTGLLPFKHNQTGQIPFKINRTTIPTSSISPTLTSQSSLSKTKMVTGATHFVHIKPTTKKPVKINTTLKPTTRHQTVTIKPNGEEAARTRRRLLPLLYKHNN